MFSTIFRILGLGCRHNRITVPFASQSATPEYYRHLDWEPDTKISTGHYVVCLDCGKKMPYDWSTMKIIKTGT